MDSKERETERQRGKLLSALGTTKLYCNACTEQVNSSVRISSRAAAFLDTQKSKQNYKNKLPGKKAMEGNPMKTEMTCDNSIQLARAQAIGKRFADKKKRNNDLVIHTPRFL